MHAAKALGCDHCLSLMFRPFHCSCMQAELHDMAISATSNCWSFLFLTHGSVWRCRCSFGQPQQNPHTRAALSRGSPLLAIKAFILDAKGNKLDIQGEVGPQRSQQ